MLKKVFLGLICFSAISCHVNTTIVQHSNDSKRSLLDDGKLYAAYYQQHAAEYQALCAQAFNIAKLRLDEAIEQNKQQKPLAIVSDIDETFLNNSYFAVQSITSGKGYEQNAWAQWTEKGEATPLKGALAFYQYAVSKGVAVFYITNRYEAERKGTSANLKRFRFPFPDESHLIMRQKEASKESRRLSVAENYDIVMLLGDNLADFSSDFDHKSVSERAAAVDKNEDDFGKKFIVLPNMGYGDWESALFHYNNKLNAAQKDSILLQNIQAKPVLK